MHGRAWTRRRLLATAGAATLAAALPRGSRAAGPALDRFRSRPDLAPPAVDLLRPGTGTAPGHVLAAVQNGPGHRGPSILDGDGGLVWFRPLGHRTASNVAVQRWRGSPVLTWWEGGITQKGYGVGSHLVVDARYETVARVQAGNGLDADLHDLRLTDRGTALVTAYLFVQADLTAVGGPRDGALLESVVQEVDPVSGRVLLDWRAANHVRLDESYATPVDGVFDHFHVNSVDVGPDGNLLVSGRHTWTLYSIDRRSGEIVWRLGGKRSDFDVGPGAATAWQHDARWQPDGSITVFDNGAGQTKAEPSSRGLRLLVDERARTVRLGAQFVHPDGRSAVAMGSMEPLPDGGAFVGWGTVPGYSEFAPDGSLRLDARFRAGGQTYRAVRAAWTGRPRGRPVLAVGLVEGRQTAFASWNGATGVARWRLLAGPSEDALRPVGSVPRRGFETEIPLRGGARRLAVEALDGRGRVLARSRPRRA